MRTAYQLLDLLSFLFFRMTQKALEEFPNYTFTRQMWGRLLRILHVRDVIIHAFNLKSIVYLKAA